MVGVKKDMRKLLLFSYFHLLNSLGKLSCALTLWLWLFFYFVCGSVFLLLHIFYNASFRKVEGQVTIFFLDDPNGIGHWERFFL